MLCRMPTAAVKNMMRPGTARIGKAFDGMMAKAKRRSFQRRQDPNIAIERCFTAFSGRGKRSLSIPEFARRLSVLSMEWSGNFSKEEYLALAQDISDEDLPGTITLESFRFAAEVGVTFLSQGHSSRRKMSGIVDYRSAAAMNSSEGTEGSEGDEGNVSSLFSGTKRDRDGRRTRRQRKRVGVAKEYGTNPRDAVETTLQHAASRARSAGQDVWKLLDISIQESLAEARDVEDDDDTPASEEVASQTSLSPDMLLRFLSKLDVLVLPSLSPPPRPLRASFEGSTGGGDRTATSSVFPVSTAFEGKNRVSPVERPGGRRSLTPSSLMSTRPNAFGSNERLEATGASSECVGHLRAISSKTVSVRCRVDFLNQELARAHKEAESLMTRRPTGTASPSLSPPPPEDRGMSNGRGFELPRRLTLDVNGFGSVPPSSSGGCGGGGNAPVAVEIVSKLAARIGGRGGDGARSARRISPRDGPVLAFSRISPVGRADPSHPTVQFKSRPGSTPKDRGGGTKPSSLRSTPGCQVQPHPGHAGASIATADVGGGTGKSPPDTARRNTEEAVITKSDRVAKLLLAALAETKGKGVTSPAPSPRVENRKIAATPRAACFDPPSVRNGLTGLTTGEIDGILLRVEASIPGSLSCWKSPVGVKDGSAATRRGLATFSTASLSPPAAGWESMTAEARRERRQRTKDGEMASVDWFDALASSGQTGRQEETGEGVGGKGRVGGSLSGSQKGAGGGGRRGVRPMMKVDRPPKASTRRSSSGVFQIPPTPAAAQHLQSERRKNTRLDIEHTRWASSGEEDEDKANNGDFIGSNPMYARPANAVTKRTTSSSSKPRASDPRGAAYEGYQGDFAATATAGKAGATRSVRRPQRAFQQLDQDVYDEFLNCTKG
ncbi:unnamed protein product [Scytosiphon promiscuus]